MSAVDFMLFFIGMALALSAESIGLRALGSVIAGLKLASLSTLAHDAAHNSLTGSRTLNKVLAVICFLPCLFNYRLWVYDHHVLHHPRTNGPHVDSYRPMSLEDYRAAPAWRRAWERFIRSPNPAAFGLYYIVQRWSQVKVMPWRSMPAKVRKEAWPHFALIAGYVVILMGSLAHRSGGDLGHFALDAFLVLGLPFFVFQCLMAGALYLNHTHPSIPWFRTEQDRQAHGTAAEVTVHVRLPKLLATLLHNFLEHPAHHVLPNIPSYRLWSAQQRLNELLGPRAIVVGPRDVLSVFRRCKLYDYQNRRWLDFNGQPTT